MPLYSENCFVCFEFTSIKIACKTNIDVTNSYDIGKDISKELIQDRDILLMHPGPVIRNIDISDEMLEDSRCKVLTQVNNGVFIRMAILKLLLLDSKCLKN